MKKLFIFAALAFGLASCESTNENIFGFEVNNEKPVEFTIKVTTPEAAETRADYLEQRGYSYSYEGGLANGVISTNDPDNNVTLRYILDIYDQYNKRSDERYIEYSDDISVNFQPRLIPNRKYTFVVWVDIVKKDNNGNWVNAYYDTDDLINVAIKADAWKPMDESRDAFTGYTEVNPLTNTSGTIDVTCTRPFAKLRIITTDEQDVHRLHVEPAYASVQYNAVPAYTFNAMTGTYTPATPSTMEKIHATFKIADYVTSNNSDNELCLFTDYFFAPDGGSATSMTDFSLSVYHRVDKNGSTEDQLITTNHFLTNIPLKRNTLTTIQGNMLTIQNFTVKATTMDQFATSGNTVTDDYPADSN